MKHDHNLSSDASIVNVDDDLAQMIICGPFDDLGTAGLLSDLIPILPPDAVLISESKVQPRDLGKVPGKYLGDGTWCGFTDFTKHVATGKDAYQWSLWPGAGAGVIGRQAPAWDLDVNDEALVDQLEAYLLEELGPAPCRIGRAPRRLLPYRCDEPLGKVTLVLKRDGKEAGRVEFLGARQQYVVAGIHQKTGKPYTWPRGDLASLGLAGLSPITRQQVEEAFAGIEDLAIECGYAVERLGRVKGAGEMLGGEIPDSLPTDDRNMPRARQAFELHLGKWKDRIPEGGRDDAVYKCAAALFDFIAHKATVSQWMFEELWPLIEGDFPQAQFEKCTEQGRRSRQEKVGSKAVKPAAELYDPATLKSIDGEITNGVPGSEDDLAVEFTRAYGHRLRFVPDWNKWLAFNGQRWVEASEPSIWNLARPLLRETADRLAETPGSRRKMTSKATTAAVTSLARGDALARAEQFDADPWVLNTPGGIADLRTGELRPADPAAYCTKMAAVAPSQGAGHPLWSKFLDDVTAGDVELQGYLQRFAGYCLTAQTSEHAMQFFYGTGANGKGVYLGTMGGILGSYAKVAPVDTFSETKGDRHPTDMAMLQGARFVSAQETDEGRHWAEAKVKALTGGDEITARFMRGDFFTYRPQFKLVIAGNHKPRLRNVDEAFRRRLHFVPFTVTIPEKDRDPLLAEKLKAEWPAILHWAVDGCIGWQTFGLEPPAIVRDTTKEYFTAQDPLAEWIEAECVRGAWTSHKDLYASWQEYLARNNDYDPMGPKAFSQRLESHGYKPAKKNDGIRGFAGLVLRLK